MSDLAVNARLRVQIPNADQAGRSLPARQEATPPSDRLEVSPPTRIILRQAALLSRERSEPAPDRSDLGTALNKTLLSSLIAAGVFRDAPRDKLLHAVASAAISTGVAEATGNPLVGLLASSGTGVAKELVDSSPLNPTGSRDLQDLAADLKGAGLGFGVSLGFWLIERYLKHRQIQQIPDQIALYTLLQKAEQNPEAAQKFLGLLEIYPSRDELLALGRKLPANPDNRRLQAVLDKNLKVFNRYLIEHLQPEIAAEKKKLGAAIEEALKKDRVRQALEVAGTGGMLVRNATPLADTLSRMFRSGAPAVRLLYKAAPGLSALSTVKVAYDTARDLENPRYNRTVKALSLGELGWSAVGVASCLVPAVGLPLAIASIAGGIGTHLVKRYAVRKQGTDGIARFGTRPYTDSGRIGTGLRASSTAT